MTPINLAAAPSMQGHILGTLGASGAALACTVILWLGVKGHHKIKLNRDQAAIWGLIAGTLYAAAVGVWSAAGSLTQSIAAAVQGGIGGNVGLGAIALALTAIIYGAKLKPRGAAVCGIAAATIYASAGGIWGLASTILSGLLNQVLGA